MPMKSNKITFQTNSYIVTSLENTTNVLIVITVESIGAALTDPEFTVTPADTQWVGGHVIGVGNGSLSSRRRWAEVEAVNGAPGEPPVLNNIGVNADRLDVVDRAEEDVDSVLTLGRGWSKASLLAHPLLVGNVHKEEFASSTFLIKRNLNE